jgi:hypothetical protein
METYKKYLTEKSVDNKNAFVTAVLKALETADPKTKKAVMDAMAKGDNIRAAKLLANT